MQMKSRSTSTGYRKLQGAPAGGSEWDPAWACVHWRVASIADADTHMRDDEPEQRMISSGAAHGGSAILAAATNVSRCIRIGQAYYYTHYFTS